MGPSISPTNKPKNPQEKAYNTGPEPRHVGYHFSKFGIRIHKALDNAPLQIHLPELGLSFF